MTFPSKVSKKQRRLEQTAKTGPQNPRYEDLWMSSTSNLGRGRNLDWGEATQQCEQLQSSTISDVL